MAIFIKGFKFNAPVIFRKEEMSQIKFQFYTKGEMVINRDIENYIIRSDEKIMRQDVIGSILIIPLFGCIDNF